MTREFIILPSFDREWERMGMTDENLKVLQEELTIDPKKGVPITGTGGLRKIRVAFDGRGKSGSVRVCYVDFEVYEQIYLITAYPKNEKDNLSKEEKNNIKTLIKLLERTIKNKK